MITANYQPKHSVSSATCTKPRLASTLRQAGVTALFHLRSLHHRSHAQPRLGLALTAAVLATAGLALTGASTAAFTSVELHSPVTPLAPAPAAPHAPHFTFAPPRHLLRNLHPLAGLASWYGSMWNGRPTASGETYDETQMTAAHPTLPLGTRVRVTDLHSMRSVIVRINDRGSLAPGRIIDLSSAAAREIGLLERGLSKVKLEILPRHQ